MTRRFAFAAALAVALAGCGAFAPAGDAGTPEGTVTPLPVLTDTPSPGGPLSPPPGVAANGSVSPSPLAAAHHRALADRSFTWTVEYERRDLDAGIVVDTLSKRLRAGDDGSALLRTTRSTGRRTLLYADEAGAYSRTVLNNASTVRRLRTAADYRSYLTTTQSLRTYLTADDASVSRIERRGETYYRVHVTVPPVPIRVGHPKQTVRNYSATAYLTPEGRVSALAVSYDYTFRTDHVGVSLRTGYDRVGETTVERPPWVPTNATARPSTNEPSTGTPPTETPITVPSRVPPPAAAEATTPGRVGP